MCYHAEFGRSALKDVSINTEENPKIGERWDSARLGHVSIRHPWLPINVP